MLKPNPNPVFRNRKGIYAHFDPAQSLVCDERWQFISLGAGYIQFDNENTRPAPFAEPRRDALTWTLRLTSSGGWEPDVLAVHASTGRREARVSWAMRDGAEFASFCWQNGSDVRRVERAWQTPTALGFQSGFAMTALLHGLPPNDNPQIDVVWMDTLSFAPRAGMLSITRLGRETQATHFGPRALEGFGLACDFPEGLEAHAPLTGQAWRDESGIVQAWLGADGSAIRLTAVN